MSNQSTSRYHAPPSQSELFVLVAVSFAVTWAMALLLHQGVSQVVEYGDNGAYLEVANAIRRWDFQHVYIQHFMGYPYFIAAASILFHLPTSFALWLVAVISSVVSVWLVAEFFGTVPAAYFALTNISWIELSFFDGSEPLVVALGLGSLLAFRRSRFFLAALLGSLAVTVRPLMIFILVGIGLVLLYRKQFLDFFVALGTGIAIGALYVLPLFLYLAGPLQNIHSYTTHDYGGGRVAGPHGHLFGWPFHGIIAGTLAYPAPWTNLLMSFFWIGLVLLGTAMMFTAAFRKYARTYPQEAIFCGLYLLATFSYDYLLWARSNFIRFSIPILPLVFFALLPLLPKDRRFLWLLSVVGAILATLSAVGVRNVVGHI